MQDIREQHLANAAIATGVRIRLDHWGAPRSDVARLYLAGRSATTSIAPARGALG